MECPKCKKDCTDMCSSCPTAICPKCDIAFHICWSTGYVLGHTKDCGVPLE